jgi:cyclase
MAVRHSPPESDRFKLVPAGDGIWAAISTDPIHSVSNSSIVDLGGRWLVVDTFYSAKSATDLRAAVRALAGDAPVWVANTHFHNDHVGGNEVFSAAAAILATAPARERVLAAGAGIPERLRAAEAAAAEIPADDPRRPDAEARAEVLRHLKFVAPDSIVGESLTLHGDRRRAELVALGTAHTNSDMAVHLPDDGVLLTGDVVVNRTLPFVHDGDAVSWCGVLARLRGLNAATIVPGHGQLADPATIDEMDACLAGLLESARGLGTGVAPRLPERFAGWGTPQRWVELVGLVAARLG